jgi:hypothetical protein
MVDDTYRCFSCCDAIQELDDDFDDMMNSDVHEVIEPEEMIDDYDSDEYEDEDLYPHMNVDANRHYSSEVSDDSDDPDYETEDETESTSDSYVSDEVFC